MWVATLYSRDYVVFEVANYKLKITDKNCGKKWLAIALGAFPKL
jgi:hypothetical protein